MSETLALVIVQGALIATIFLSLLVAHRLRMFWRNSLRRETVLLALVDETSPALGARDFEAFARAWSRNMIALQDECHNQDRHARDFWPRVPQPGEQWPDFEPATVIMGGE